MLLRQPQCVASFTGAEIHRGTYGDVTEQINQDFIGFDSPDSILIAIAFVPLSGYFLKCRP
jgi:hypothetical protein